MAEQSFENMSGVGRDELPWGVKWHSWKPAFSRNFDSLVCILSSIIFIYDWICERGFIAQEIKWTCTKVLKCLNIKSILIQFFFFCLNRLASSSPASMLKKQQLLSSDERVAEKQPIYGSFSI